MPEDLENFAQVSKHIRSVSDSALEEHRQLIRKYKTFTGLATAGAVEPLLKDVLADPRIGHYVKRIDLRGVSRDDSEDEDENEQGSVKAKKGISIEQIHAAVHENPLLNPGHLRWIHERIDKGKKDILICLLLPLLPNLLVLSIADTAHLEVFYKMIERALKMDARFLSKLEHVHIQAYGYEHNTEYFMLNHLSAFVPLPSLRRLSGMRVWQSEWRGQRFMPPQISNITQLDLQESRIGSTVLDRYLRYFPHLQSFVYTNSDEGDPPDLEGSHFDPFVIRAALEARASTTLQRLTILSNADKDRKTFMGPLCGFKVLEHVHGDLNSLIPYVAGHVREILSSILPKSLKVLSLRGHDEYYQFKHEELIDHAIQAKTGPDSPLPLLEKLEFTMLMDGTSGIDELQNDDYQTLRQRCDEVGLSLVITLMC